MPLLSSNPSGVTESAYHGPSQLQPRRTFEATDTTHCSNHDPYLVFEADMNNYEWILVA